MSATWEDLIAEAQAFEAWHSTRLSINAWVGITTGGDYYGGWSIEGDTLYDEWDESEMTTAEGPTPEEVIADLIKIARRYRQRRDEERAEWMNEEAVGAGVGVSDSSDASETPVSRTNEPS